jgi:predicted alpha/beta-fold hydrolase
MKGWRTLVANHRGLGGVSITSDRLYNAGWTEDLRTIIHYVHEKYPRAPLFTIGTSIGANILVKYLGEEGAATPVGAAAAVCSPWDLVVCDRFMSRKTIQKIYNMVLATGLRQYANMYLT